MFYRLMRTTILATSLLGAATFAANAQSATGSSAGQPASPGMSDQNNAGQSTGALPERKSGGPTAKTLRGHQDRQAMKSTHKMKGHGQMRQNAQPNAGMQQQDSGSMPPPPQNGMQQ